VLSRQVIAPLGSLDRAMARVADGQDPGHLLQQGGAGGAGEMQRLIRHFTHMAAAVLQARRDLEHKVGERTAALDRLTKIDPLTELFNRRGMGERLAAELERARRAHTHVGLLWLDVDWFKTINDSHGHAVGDAALKSVARSIQSVIRPYDVAARWGGDEFVVLLPEATPEALAALGERLRTVVAAATDLHGAQGQPLHPGLRLSISIGGHLAQPGDSLDSLLHQADQALYAAKAAGRGCYRSSTDAQAFTPQTPPAQTPPAAAPAPGSPHTP
jgi:diguanylate cyclase (GGDEF)-like protein